MGDTLKRWAFSVGLTRRRSKELSEIIEEEAVFMGMHPETNAYPVRSSHYFNENGMMRICTNYFVNFKTGTRNIEFCDKWFYENMELLGLKMGDKVLLEYNDRYKLVFDYEPPDFSQKKQIDKETFSLEAISAKRI